MRYLHPTFLQQNFRPPIVPTFTLHSSFRQTYATLNRYPEQKTTMPPTTSSTPKNEPAFSKPRLDRMHQVLSGYIERKEMPGLVALVSHHDDVHIEALGTLTFDQTAPIRTDTIFRIASLAKPVTAVAAMILLEECKLRLDESIEPWIPELANRQVLKSLSGPLDDTVPAERPITVRDLLTFRMGFGSVMAPPDTYPIQKLIREYQIGGDGPPRPSQAPTAEKWLQRLSSLPWMAQPGERWLYHMSSDRSEERRVGKECLE